MSDQTQASSGFNPMGMMQKMMGQMKDEGMKPMQMCKMMTSSVAQAAEMATWATPELRALFDDWAGQVRQELLTQLADLGEDASLEALAEKMNLGPESVEFLVISLAREGRLKLKISPVPGV